MNLRGIANSVSSMVNANVTITVLRSTGYTIGTGRKQVPSYATPATGPAQIQALDGNDLKQLDGLNIQGTIRSIYLAGAMAGTLRPDSLGGDVVQITTGIHAGEWLVVKVLEAWETWTKAAIVKQQAAGT